MADSCEGLEEQSRPMKKVPQSVVRCLMILQKPLVFFPDEQWQQKAHHDWPGAHVVLPRCKSIDCKYRHLVYPSFDEMAIEREREFISLSLHWNMDILV